MRKIALYIADMKVDISDDALVLMNYTFEDLSNPTIVKNSYSKQIKLEGTPQNNAIFGNIWKYDRVTEYGAGYTGKEFDATRKTPFRIFDDGGIVIVSGYCKLDGIKRNGDAVTYEISLYGGVGSFFNALTYNEDGSLRTLADMQYQDAYETWIPARSLRFPTGGRTKIQEVKYAWDNFGESDDLYNAINFGVFYEGVPKDFDADKMLSNHAFYKNYPDTRTDGGRTYGMKGRASLMKMGRAHTAWEMKDLRWYLLRPVFNMWELVNALKLPENVRGMKVSVSKSILNETGGKYDIGDLWVTLRRLTKEDKDDVGCLVNVLESSLTPADYIIGMAKFFGWVVVYSEDRGVEIMPRSEFFARDAGQVIDLSGRIDEDSISLSSNTAESKYYQMGGAKPVTGEFPVIYKETHGKEYGVQTINTGYDFNDKTSILTEKGKLTEGCDALEYLSVPLDAIFATSYATGTYNGISNNEAVTQELWSGDERREFPCTLAQQVSYAIGFGAVKDAKRKTQMHARNNEAQDGSNMFVLYRGRFSGALIPYITNSGEQWRNQPYYLTDDIDEMDSLNAGVPCWNLTGLNSIEVKTMPLFNREGADNTHIENPLYYGKPLEVSAGAGVIQYDASIYERFWKDYLTDRYDTDAKVLRCKVDLQGMQVGQEMLGRFYYIGNALWVLNKVTNYSLTTDDLTECEFIKVKDKNNYIK